MNVIFLFGAIQALFFIFLVLNKKDKHKADRILILWILAMGLHVASFYTLVEGLFNKPIGILMLLVPPLIYCSGPLLFIYTLTLSKKKFQMRWFDWLHFVPFITSLFTYGYLYIFKANMDLNYFASGNVVTSWLGMVFYLLNVFMNPVYVIIVLIKLRKHRKNIKNEFSYTSQIDLNWLKILTLGLGSVSVMVWIVHALIGFGVLNRAYQTDTYIFMTVVIFIFVLGFFGFKQGIIYKYVDTKTSVNKNQPKYEKANLEDSLVEDYIEKLNTHMTKHLPYKKSKLSLNQLASELEISSHTLSQILNVHVKKSFYDYINSFRVEEVKRNISGADFSTYSLLGIAYEAGFNSKTSFNRIFKQHTGKTPTQYRNSVLNS